MNVLEAVTQMQETQSRIDVLKKVLTPKTRLTEEDAAIITGMMERMTSSIEKTNEKLKGMEV